MNLGHQVTTCLPSLGSCFETATANISRSKISEQKVLGFILLTMSDLGSEHGLAP